ncbi:MAG TPA: hypothetical protein VH639_28795 [Bryobacteraceae bacterium]
MEKPESEMTAAELRVKASGIAQEASKLPTGAVTRWIETMDEAKRLYALAKQREAESQTTE